MKTSPLKKMEHGLKRVFFAASKIYLKKGRKGFKGIDPAGIKRVLFIRPDKLGDMIISLPVFHNLKKRYPHLELFTICSPRNVAIIRNNENIVRNFLYTKHLFHDIAMVREIRRLGIEAVVDMVCDDSTTSLFLAQFSSAAGRRIGLGKNRHRPFYDYNCRYRAEDEHHIIDNTLKLLTAFGLDAGEVDSQVPPTIDNRSYRKADDYFASLDGPASGGIIGLNISAGRPTRVWPDKKNIELLARLIETYATCRFIISSVPSDRGRAVSVAEKFPSRVAPLPPGLNLLDVSAIISRMRLLITPDTSLVHIARSFKVPVVGLYTRFSKNFNLWRPYNQKNGAVISGNDYNIFDIGVEQVFDAVTTLLPPGDQT
jgi:heptosyltransferase-3